MILVSLTVYTWNLYNVRLNEDLEYEKIQLIAFQITDLLVKSPGYPAGWEENPSNVGIIGLAQNDRVLSQDKVTAFMNLEYNSSKERFNIEYYDYKFKIKSLSNSVMQESGLNFGGDTSVVIERYVLLDDERRIMEFTLWK